LVLRIDLIFCIKILLPLNTGIGGVAKVTNCL
jgi:hypothetical protein